MAENLVKVDQSGRLFGDLYNTHLKSWMTEEPKPQLPRTGEVVAQTHAKLKDLTEVGATFALIH